MDASGGVKTWDGRLFEAFRNAHPAEETRELNANAAWMWSSNEERAKYGIPARFEDADQAQPGVKHDSNKPRPSLLPPIALEELIAVLEYGAQKYSPDNWAEGPRRPGPLPRRSYASSPRLPPRGKGG